MMVCLKGSGAAGALFETEESLIILNFEPCRGRIFWNHMVDL